MAPGDETEAPAGGFIWAEERSDGRSPRSYPPDDALELPRPATFSRILLALVLLLLCADAVRIGYVFSPIPYNYPVPVGALYAVAVIPLVRRIHAVLDGIKSDVVSIAARTSAEARLGVREGAPVPETIEAECDQLLETAFHPGALLGGALVGAAATVVVLGVLDLSRAYPYTIVNLVYGASHGLLIGPFVAACLLWYRVTTSFAVGLDAFDPDGVGGYRTIGGAAPTLASYAVGLLTLDLLVLSSAGYLVPTIGPYVAYAGGLLGILVLVAFGRRALGRRLRRLRRDRASSMRRRFDREEAQFWLAVAQGTDPSPHDRTLRTMGQAFDHLRRTSPTPANRPAMARLIVVIAASLAIAAAAAVRTPGAL